MTDSVQIAWCRSPQKARDLARLFAANISASYISHSELQSLRAVDPVTWAADIAGQLEADVAGRIDQPLDAPAEGRTMLAAGLSIGARDVGVTLVTFARDAQVPYAVIEDLVVDPACRSKGYGQILMDWIAAECRARNITRIFLESGIENHRAHDFFKQDGFQPVSVVMMKTL